MCSETCTPMEDSDQSLYHMGGAVGVGEDSEGCQSTVDLSSGLTTCSKIYFFT